MKITIGHVLVVGGVAGVLGLGPLYKMDFSKLFSKIENINFSLDTVKKLIPFQKEIRSILPAPVSPMVVENPPAPPPPVAMPVAVEAPPVPEPKKISEPVQKKTVKSRRKARRKTKAAVAATTQAKKAPAKSATKSSNALMGTYVTVSLKTGREVKGVYQKKTATHYVIELPGMGPFEYPIENVAGIKPAE